MTITLRTLALTVALLSGCTLVKTAPIPQTEDQKVEVAREIVVISSAPFLSGELDPEFDFLPNENSDIYDLCEVFETDDEIARCEQHAPSVLAEFKAAKEQYIAAQKAMAPQVIEDSARMMARVLSGEELVAMREYYQSPVGKSALGKRLQIQAGLADLEEKHFATAERAYKLKINEISQRFEALVQPTH